MIRKIVQIAFDVDGNGGSACSALHALADDGTIWYYHGGKGAWQLWELPPLPDKKEEEES